MSDKMVVLQEGNFPSQCSGCRMCELVCSFIHFKHFNPSLSCIRVTHRESDLIDYPVVCRQCHDPPCIKACPVSAISRDNPLEVNQINEELCLGCGECTLVCPFGAIYIPSGKKAPVSCNLCEGNPQCVRYCPSQVLKFKSTEEIAKAKRQTVINDETQ